MTSSSPIFAPVKRVAVPGIIFSSDQNNIKSSISFSTNSLEFRTLNKAVIRLTRPLVEVVTKSKTNDGLSLDLTLENLELLDNTMFFSKSKEPGFQFDLSWLKNHIHKIQLNAFMLKIANHLMYPMLFNRSYNNELIR